MDLTCPVCNTPLLETRSTRAVMWTCPTCRGRAIGVSLLRRATEGRWAGELWQQALAASSRGERLCPSCRTAMVDVTDVEICKGCQLVWFDAADFEAAPFLPERGARTLPEEALEKIARTQAALIAADYKVRFGQTMALADALPLVPGVMGLPIEEEVRGLHRYPWVTWALTIVVALVGFWSVAEPDSARRFALVATDVDRSSGATLVAALFVHATVFQLVTNAYFLLLFGDNVEDFLGPLMFMVLFVTGGLIGNVLHVVLAADSATPLLGASGAISAIVVFYACKFPNVQLRVTRLVRWHSIPALSGLLFWLLTKAVSTTPVLGRAEPSLWPYVGGAAVGLAFWFFLRDDFVSLKPARSGS